LTLGILFPFGRDALLSSCLDKVGQKQAGYFYQQVGEHIANNLHEKQHRRFFPTANPF
jgi:hypothetical protein